MRMCRVGVKADDDQAQILFRPVPSIAEANADAGKKIDMLQPFML
jgi:hypothetical protein